MECNCGAKKDANQNFFMQSVLGRWQGMTVGDVPHVVNNWSCHGCRIPSSCRGRRGRCLQLWL